MKKLPPSDWDAHLYAPLDYVPTAPVYKPRRALARAIVAAAAIPLLAVGVPAFVALYCIHWAIANLAEWLEPEDAQ